MNELDLGLNDPLALSTAQLTALGLTRPQREKRVADLIQQSRDFLQGAIEEHVWRDGLMVAAKVGLFSGGNDSTTLVHLFRNEVDFAAHANTGIGIEQTRQFVRDTCAAWDLQLIERAAPREADHYRSLVLSRETDKKGNPLGGFPGPAMHFKMFTRLKERALMQVRRELVTNSRRERVVFLAGRRRDESARRARVPLSERQGAVVYVSPLINWTKSDLNTYRLMCGDVPVNEVSDLIHMSGECLCGSFASPGEREEITYWFPEIMAEIAELERELADREDIPEHRKTWGWGADPAKKRLEGRPSNSGLLCSSCDDRFQTAFNFEEGAA